MKDISDKASDESDKGKIRILMLKSPEARKRRSNLSCKNLRLEQFRTMYHYKGQKPCYRINSE